MKDKKKKYMAGGGKMKKYMAGGGKMKKYMAGGGATKEPKIEAYKDYVQRIGARRMAQKRKNYQ